MKEKDHTFIHAYTSKINKIKQDISELHELVENYVQTNIEKPNKDLDGMTGFEL